VQDEEGRGSRYVYEERRRIAREGRRGFDALAFARRALRILDPKAMTVALYPGRFDVRVERGRDWSRGPESSWAMVAIPPGATREHIAVALAELAGVAHLPYVVETLVAEASRDS
jgi:hypothetical protein